MGRHSDSEEDRKKSKKKKKKRSRSRSRSVSSGSSKLSSKHKKSKKSKHKKRSRSKSRSPSWASERIYRRSRSRSRHRSGSRSRHRSRSRSRHRSRSRSRDRYYRRYSPSSKDRRRSRSRSYERRSRSRSYSPERRSRNRRSRSYERRRDGGKNSSPPQDPRKDSCLTSSIPGFDDMSAPEQAKIRMQLALKAAAMADERIREQLHTGESVSPLTQMREAERFASAVRDIESSSFTSTAFKSSAGKTVTVKEERLDPHEQAMFGAPFGMMPGKMDLKLELTDTKFLQIEPDSYAHEDLYCNPEEKMQRWLQKLTAMRRRKLEGTAF